MKKRTRASRRVRDTAKRRLTAKRGAKRVTIGVRLRNSGDAAASGVRVCADVPKRRFAKRLKIAGGRCRTIALAAGQSKVLKIEVRLKRGARGRTTPVRIRVSGGNAPARSFSVQIRARR